MDNKIGLLTPVKTFRKSAIVADKIKSLILDNQYGQGEKLPSESELGRIFSVSRASVREAFRALELMGLIEVKSGSGTYVKNAHIVDLSKFSNSGLVVLLESEASTMLEILEARRIFEINIVELAAENTVPEDLNRIEIIISEMEASLNNEEGFKNADLNFHSEVARLTKNRVIESLANAINQIFREKFPRTYSIVCNDPKLAKRMLNLHKQILETLKAQDPKRAKAYMAKHMKVAYRISKEYLEQLMEAEGIVVKRLGRENKDKRKEKRDGKV